MSEREQVKKSVVAISLPRKFYNDYMKLRLFEEFSSFSDMVRDAVRKQLSHFELRKDARERHELTT